MSLGPWQTDGRPAVNSSGEIIECDACQCCNGVSEAPANCFDAIECLADMFVVLEVEFQDNEQGDWSLLNGSYPLPLTSVDPGITFQATGNGKIERKFFDASGFVVPRDGPYAGFAVAFECDEDGNFINVRGAAIGYLPIQFGGPFGGICIWCLATASVPFTPLSGGQSIDLTPVPRPTTDCNSTLDMSLTRATVKLYGKPCDSSSCAAGPTAAFTYDNVIEDGAVDACDPLHPPVDLYRGCIFSLEATATPGECPVIGCFWDDGGTGCSRAYRGPSECGPFSEDVTLYVVDEGGCVASVTHTLTCCNCCPPVGSNITIAFDVGCLGGVACDEGTPIHPGCDTDDTDWHRGQITFPDIAETDCEDIVNTAYWSVDFDGLRGCDCNPITQLCFDPGEVVDFAFDSGAITGISHCIRCYPVDLLGCIGDPVSIFLVAGNAYNPALAVPDNTNGCYSWQPFFCEEYWGP